MFIFICILFGISGLLVFVDFSSGIISPTFGYLIGFLSAVLIVNQSLKSRYNPFISNLFSCFAGIIIIFIFGVSRLALYLGLQQAILQRW
ncbi:MAG: biotin transporter BioY [Wolbachia endosymbiont of Fragariocoptes setiger]|nr:biotin transporter BioY [Wolbachia endosymbiont of Fragariocoptes setiger]